jgi:aspartyl-tRNA(Asn)/glutamyl-tRNA(Gln) amidotransferase subunit B
MPELPPAKRERYQREFELSAYDTAALTADRGIADYFEETTRLLEALAKAALGMQQKQAAQTGVAKLVTNWVIGDLAARLNSDQIEIAAAPVPPGKLAGLLVRLVDQTLSNKIAKDVFAAMWAGEQGGDADAIIGARGLKQVSDSGELEKVIDGVLAANPKSVEEFRAGKEKAFNALVGQAMKATKGKGNPAQINEILKKKLVN